MNSHSNQITEASKIAKKAARRAYPELLAKSCNDQNQLSKVEALYSNLSGIESDYEGKGLEKFISKSKAEPKDKRYRCTPGMITGETTGKYFFKMVTCGRDWCPDCGKIYSQTHSRRIVINIPRVKQILQKSKLQYLIITIPAQLRINFNNKEALNDFRTYWRRKLKREGYKKGVMRYHWAGEDGYIFKPHLNILMPGGWISKNMLAKWRAELAVWFQNYCGTANLPKANIYTAYTSKEEKAKHWVSYVFRSTQVSFNKWSEKTIVGYRNTSVFGKFDPIEKTEEEIAAELLKGFFVDEETGEVEKIRWKMKYSEKRKCLVPDLTKFEDATIEACTLISRGFWTRDRILKPPPDSRQKIKSISGKDFFNFTE
jgi:hypothetical protein